MTFMYEELESVMIATDKDGKQYFIPKNEANSDYQVYLNSEQNEAASK